LQTSLTEINIISFDVPYPANYGGVIDVFYKIKYFYSKGIKIHLHCFEYGRGEQKELNKYCTSVNYYKRKTGVKSQISSTPYIVKSRTSKKLKENLLKNDFPILFEGLHSCFLLDDKKLKNRFKIFRESNIEHDYYNHLAKAEKNVVKKKYYTSEAKKLEKFESIVKHADVTCVVSLTDLKHFQSKYPNNKTLFVPSFHSGESVNVKSGKGQYILYHGNLSVAENDNAAQFIIKKLFNESALPLKIAGLNPSKDLINLIKKYPNIELIQNPSDKEMASLIANAQINLLYTEQATGLKLKLLNVLYNGRHCIVNPKMVEGTSLGRICLVEQNITELKKLIQTTFKTEITDEDVEVRNILLSREYSNEVSFQKMMLELKLL
jgi:hypothetical protein